MLAVPFESQHVCAAADCAMVVRANGSASEQESLDDVDLSSCRCCIKLYKYVQLMCVVIATGWTGQAPECFAEPDTIKVRSVDHDSTSCVHQL